MKNKNLIAISGKAGSGKDIVGKIIQYLTVSDYDNVKGILKERNSKEITIEEHFNSFIERNYKVEYKIKKFAGKLKQIVSILTGIPVEDLEKHEVKDRVLGEEGWYCLGDNNTRSPYVKELHEEKVIKLIKPTVRDLMIEIADKMKEINPDTFVNALFVDYKATDCDCDGPGFCGDPENHNTRAIFPNWIITDMRFPNELQAVKDRGGITIRVNRVTGNVLIDNDTHAVTDWQHPSETELDDYEDWDHVINNDGTINDLIEKVRKILEKEEII